MIADLEPTPAQILGGQNAQQIGGSAVMGRGDTQNGDILSSLPSFDLINTFTTIQICVVVWRRS